MFKELTWVGWAHFLQFYQQYLWHVIFLHFEAKFAEIIIAVLIIYKISFMNISKSSGHLFQLETTAMMNLRILNCRKSVNVRFSN